MRAKERLGIMLLFLYAFCFISCDKDDDNVENIAVMSVSPELVWMRDPRVQVMECIIEGDNEKLYIAPSQIEGFEYNKGYDYKLKVKVTPLENPSTDGATVRYELREIIYEILHRTLSAAVMYLMKNSQRGHLLMQIILHY